MNANTNAHSMILDVSHLCVDYLSESGEVHAVSDVSLRLRRGEILGLAGESGSGKSTMAYAITRLLRPPAEISRGEVLYYGRESDHSETSMAAEPIDILRLNPAELRAIRWSELAIVFQSAMNALNPTMTVGNQLLDVLATHRPEMPSSKRRERARELFEMVGIAAERLKSYPHELSGGMRQRATIAIALALSPKIIIMDEPTTALDVVVQREILTELLRLREQLDLSIIFITHDLSLLLEIADTIAIMYAGRVVEMTSARKLHHQPLHPYSFGMLHSFPSLHGERRLMTGIAGSPPDLRNVPTGCAFHPRCPLAFAPCTTVVPDLLRSPAGHVGQSVACHRYDPSHAAGMEPPTAAEMEEGYSALSSATLELGRTPA
ncbi:MAG TPA: ABC transporter ATP-binding protein [Ktedonobacterales bacterium]|nr:ABC transporter ATP-binding protein [Ktedonobacterales bacterium]